MRARVACLALALTGGCLHDWDAIPGPTADAGVDDIAVDAPVGVDAIDVPVTIDAPDAPAAIDAPDAPAAIDAPDAPAAIDATDATDATDAPDASDAADVPINPCMASSGTLCGGTCVDTLTDARNCGACGTNCATLPHSTAGARCSVGLCQLDGVCAPGFADCDSEPANGCEAPLNTTTDCGFCRRSCGTPLNASSACTGVACSSACNAGYARINNVDCAAFGGATATNDRNFVACMPNPLSEECSCLGGFDASPTFDLTGADEAGGSTPAALRLCGVSGTAAVGEWGGAYLRASATTGACHVGNPYAAGRCACPGGFDEQQELRVLDTNQNAAALVLCGRPGVGTRTYLGAFEVLLGGYVRQDDHTSTCLVPNVANAGQCACPAGARSIAVSAAAPGARRAVGGLYENTARAPARITVCMR
ncbi:MAG: Tryptophan synthase alpha chain [Myxococcaceae bacterium]|nr:Tryptophan synthase alpha chain [Myxococcaceae bacterium]